MRTSTTRFLPGLGLGALIGIAGTVAASYVLQVGIFGDGTEDRDTQIIESVTEIQEVALLELGIQGMYEHADAGADVRFFDRVALQIPWTDRTTAIPYSFQAKLGIDGEDVTIESTGEDSFAITIPEFTFIGHDAVQFAAAQEDGGAFRWVTPKADELDLANEILSDENKEEYVAQHEEDLEEQAESFYGQIVAGIDPDIDVTFSFQG